MAQGQAQFCGNCGSPREAGTSACPRCGSPYGEIPSGSFANTQEPTQLSPTAAVPSSSQPNWGNTPSTQYPGATPSRPSTEVPPPPGGYQSSGAYPPLGSTTQNAGVVPPGPPTAVSQPSGGYPPAPPPTQQAPGGNARSWGKLVVLFAVVAGLAFHDFIGTNSSTGSNQQASNAPGATATPGANPTATATLTSSSGTYSATLPGPGCDTSGGIWTPQGLDGVSCPTQSGTELVINATGARGYLYLQLPNNQAFSPNNTISVAGTLGDNGSGYQTKCIGLAELDANTGYSAEYCNTGQWSIYSISSGGSIIQTLAKNVSNVLTAAEISLSLKGSMLTFSINNAAVDAISITPIQPARVAIVYDCVGYGASSTINGNFLLVNGFSYTPTSG